MENIKCIIADKNAAYRQQLKSQIKSIRPDLQLIAEARNGEEAVSLIHELTPGIVFMDIDLPKTDGFNVVYRCTEKKFAFIVITDGEQHAYRAIKANAADYLLKPAGNKELALAIDKARLWLKTGEKAVAAVANDTQNQAQGLTLPVKSGHAYEMVNTYDIILCRSHNNYTEIRLHDKRKFLLSKTLKFYEECLKGLNFCRIHQSYLVNTLFVKSIEKGRNSHLVLKDGTRLEIAQARKEQVYKVLGL
ncbi:MAG TPA: LytTR family DNA-binding domain-containing protein [Bacteroidia bacterium]|nr:LytTR family DNA-binding domain-containing protein [Bacteroidia bacterium]